MEVIETIKIKYSKEDRDKYQEVMNFIGTDLVGAIAEEDSESSASDIRSLVDCMNTISKIWNKYNAERED